MKNKKFGDLLASTLGDLEQDVLAKVKNEHIVEEDHITASLLTLLEERINYVSKNADTESSFKVTARQFSGRGRSSQESFTGADGALGLRVNIGGVEFQKFFIFQAKKFGPKSRLDARASAQRQKMLECTPDSFFLIYTDSKICWASAFLAEQGDTLAVLPTKSFSEFNEDFFNCFIGDHFFGYPELPYRHKWRYWPYDEYPAKHNLLVTITDS